MKSRWLGDHRLFVIKCESSLRWSLKRKKFVCLALVLTMLPVSEAKADTGVIAVTTSGGDIRLSAGGSTQLQVGSTVRYYGQTYTVSRYTFNSDNRTVASVDASGRVTALKTGTAQLIRFI